MKLIARSAMLLAAFLFAVVGVAGPAHAQDDYPPDAPLAVSSTASTDGSVTGTISGGTGPYTATVSINGGTPMAITVNADGTFSLPAGTVGAGDTIVITAGDADGGLSTATLSGVPLSPVLQYPGPFNASPATIEGSGPFTAPAATAGDGGTGGGGSLAFTGAETAVVAAGGMSMVLLGGMAVVASRKRSI